MEQKVKIGHDQTKHNFLTFQVNEGIVSINTTLKTALNGIGFDLTTDTLQDCYSCGIATMKIYFERLEKDLAAISTPSTRAMLEKNAAEAFENFNVTVGKALGKVSIEARGYITIENGFAICTETALESIIEECAIYLTDSEEIELHKHHLAAVEALNSFFQGHKTADWHKLFEWDQGMFIPAMVNHTYILQRIKELKK